MVSCEGCGGEIAAGTSECPYCGRSVVQRVDEEKKSFDRDERAYRTSTDEEGLTHLQFGDGQSGSRLPSGSGSVSSHYRQGAGSQGNVSSRRLEEQLDQIERIPDPSKQKESKDLGVTLVESMGAIGDLMSLYQDSVSQEAHLSTNDRERLATKEERIRPKLEAIVAYCDRVDSKSKKKIGLSDKEIRKIQTTATRALQVTSAGKCVRCGSANRPGSKKCQNCGSPL
ncbi:MAG: hypothetical protein RTV31_13905 [Candidatus Thorarchaeota archaeon]